MKLDIKNNCGNIYNMNSKEIIAMSCITFTLYNTILHSDKGIHTHSELLPYKHIIVKNIIISVTATSAGMVRSR